jgi:hypothetical protein
MSSPEEFVTDAMGNPIPGAYVAEASSAAQAQDVGYFTRKINEFQTLVFDLDTTEANLRSFIQDYNINDPVLLEQLDAFDLKKDVFRTTAEALNLAVAGINAIGGNLPSVRIPGGLAAVPVVALAGAAAAVAAAAALIVWGREWIIGVNDRLKTREVLQQIPEAQRGQAASDLLRIEATARNAETSPLGNLANIVKYLAIAAGVYFAFQAFQKAR